jgi:hypothetical protein
MLRRKELIMSDKLEMLWQKAKDIKHDASRFTGNQTIHGLINDLIEEIEVEMSNNNFELDYNDYEDDYDRDLSLPPNGW